MSDSDLEDDEDEKTTSSENSNEPQVIKPKTPNLMAPLPATGKILCEEQEEFIEKGKVVKIPDVAFVT